MPKLWTRPHVNGWRVYVEYVPALGEGDTPGRYVASALAPDGATRGTSNHATLELAQAAASLGRPLSGSGLVQESRR